MLESTVVPKFEVTITAAEREVFWDRRKATEFLGVGRKHFDLLKEVGVVVEIPEHERPVLADGRFYSIALRDLVTRIRCTAMDLTGDTLAFSDLTGRRTTDKAALKKLINLICDGTIAAIIPEPTAKLVDFRFLKSDIDEALQSERHSQDWTANDVAKLTDWLEGSVGNALVPERTTCLPYGSARFRRGIPDRSVATRCLPGRVRARCYACKSKRHHLSQIAVRVCPRRHRNPWRRGGRQNKSRTLG